jgi:hypothetical protein
VRRGEDDLGNGSKTHAVMTYRGPNKVRPAPAENTARGTRSFAPRDPAYL